MKRFTLLVALFVFGATIAVFAKKVDVDQARQVGKNFYYLQANINTAIAFDELHITGEYVITENDMPVFYIFNINDAGFIIVTADDRVFPVIGYSFEMPWDTGEVPAHLQSWIDGYKGDFVTAVEEQYPADQTITTAWETFSSEEPVRLPDAPTVDVDPLVTSMWDQDFPNTAMWPEDPASGGSYAGHVPVGCVATGMSQIMHYWRYPETGNGSHCIYPIQPQYGQQCADYGNTTYVWDALTSDRPYRKAWTEEAALAHLEEFAGTLFDPDVVAVFSKYISAL